MQKSGFQKIKEIQKLVYLDRKTRIELTKVFNLTIQRNYVCNSSNGFERPFNKNVFADTNCRCHYRCLFAKAHQKCMQANISSSSYQNI
jgi:hypothetical protein